MLKKDQRVIFRFYYGYFESKELAMKCIEGGSKINLYSVAQDAGKENAFMFGFRRITSKVTVKSKDACVRPSVASRRSLPSARSSRFSKSAAADEDTEVAAEEPPSGEMTIAEKIAMNKKAKDKM